MDEVEAMLEAIEQMVRAHGCAAEFFAHFGLGVIIVSVKARPNQEATLARELTGLRPRLAPQGGSVVILRASPRTKAEVDVWGARSDTLDLMRRIKNEYDPQGVFAAGCFVGGL
jgi:glycolate oxidase FAD binding subunit